MPRATPQRSPQNARHTKASKGSPIAHSAPRAPHSPPRLIAIVGGSGSGKSWLAEKLQAALRPGVARFSLDDFYRDRSHLSPARRARINYDHPRAIDWTSFELVLRACLAGRPARLPCYDFKTHRRLRRVKLLKPGAIVLVDGLWLWRRPALRRLFALKVFLECSTRTRLRRRLGRDLRSRGRTRASIERQFRQTVEPMHRRYVLPQLRWADRTFSENFTEHQVAVLAAEISQVATTR
jgi:uridine kinase